MPFLPPSNGAQTALLEQILAGINAIIAILSPPVVFWDPHAMPSGNGEGWFSSIFIAGNFIATDHNGPNIATSGDGGETWTETTVGAPGSNWQGGIAFNGTQLVMVGNDGLGGGQSGVSLDNGATWTVTTGIAVLNGVSSIASDGATGFVATAGTLGADLQVSAAGVIWTTPTSFSLIKANTVVWVPFLSLYISGCDGNGASGTMQSAPAPGTTWSPHTTPSPMNTQIIMVGPSMIVTIDQSNNAVNSTDGINYATQQPVGFNPDAGAYDPASGLFVYSGPPTATSNGAGAWTSFPSTEDFLSISTDGTRLVAVGEDSGGNPTAGIHIG